MDEDYEEGIFKDYNVMVVDDVEINREILMSLLEDTGVSFEIAENGVEALEKFAQSPDRFDMIFMDMQMPEMDGVDATIHIRALDTPYASTVPIVALTANVYRSDAEKCIAAGMNAHLGKPIDLGEVIKAMKKYLLKA